jgi:hypothetical protein
MATDAPALPTVLSRTATPVVEGRAERRRKRNQADLGPSNDPIRPQGRDPAHCYIRERWYSTPQACDRSRLSRRRRLYHDTYRTSSGHTWDQLYEELAARAREYEAAGINLGWGNFSGPGAAGVRQSVEAETDRRYMAPKPNAFMKRLIEKRK